VTASAVQKDLGRKLADIDRTLMDRLEVLASSAMRRTLEKAGARVRSRVSRDENLKATIAETTNFEVASVLGEPVVASVFGNDPVFSEEFTDLEEQYDSLVGRSQKQVRELLRRNGVSEADVEAMTEQHEVERREGWLILSAILVATAGRLLYKPKVSSADVNGVQAGEFDDLSLVPPSAIRASLAVAGGNLGIQTVGGAIIDVENQPLGLMATGETTLTYLSAAGVSANGFRWVYGDETRVTFEPHLDLDGVEFTEWSDPALTNGDAFPDTSFFYPGDHNGCRCLVEYIFAE
jgi:hypothetical protein